jgi:hypothetical protein
VELTGGSVRRWTVGAEILAACPKAGPARTAQAAKIINVFIFRRFLS